jgi:hypothetical protein
MIVLSGVPQGSVPSPLFFAMFIDGLRLVIRNFQFHFYPDDLQIYSSGNKNDIDGIVARVNEDLEAVFRSSCDQNVFQGIWCAPPTATVEVHDPSKLCKALLVPQFLYSDVIFSGICRMDLDRWEVAFNSCTRYVFGLRRFDRLSSTRNFLL